MTEDWMMIWSFMIICDEKMKILLEIQEEVQLGRDWSSIQHSQNCIWECWVNNVWLWISWWYDWFMIVYDEYNDNHIGDSGGSVIGEGLKVNSTLRILNLGLRSWQCMIENWMFNV